MKERGGMARLVGGLGVGLLLGAIVTGWLTGNVGSVLMWLPATLGFVVVGWIIASHRPENPIGWLYLWLGMAMALVVGIQRYADFGLESAHAAATWAAWAGTWATWPLFTLLILPLVLFPDGGLLSLRWRWLSWLAVGAPSAAAVLRMLADISRPDELFPTVEHPIPVLAVGLADPVYEVATLGVLVALAAAAVSLVVRFRRSSEVERQQVKWLATGVAVLAVAFVVSALTTDQPQVAFALFGPAIPLTTGMAILRYRLYEIDRIISRSVSYALVAGLLGLVVASVAAVAGSQFDTPWVVAATTLGVAALFNPIRRRVQVWVDRRFNRSKYDAQRVMDGFTGSLQDRIDADEVVEGLVDVVSQTMHPASLGIWTRP